MAMRAEIDRPFESRWPMTGAALAALEADEAYISKQVVVNAGYVSGHLDGESDAPTFMPNVVGQQLLRRLTTIPSVLAQAIVVDEPDCVVIGRRVTVREPDGTTSRYEVVIPGEGDVVSGRIGADSPFGAALVGHRTGDAVTIVAPAGSWTATVARSRSKRATPARFLHQLSLAIPWRAEFRTMVAHSGRE